VASTVRVIAAGVPQAPMAAGIPRLCRLLFAIEEAIVRGMSTRDPISAVDTFLKQLLPPLTLLHPLSAKTSGAAGDFQLGRPVVSHDSLLLSSE
jgi:hypothetical protein